MSIVIEDAELTSRLQALARAAYARHKTVVLDDVFSGMDAHTSASVSRSLLGRGGLFRRDGITVIVATHNREPTHLDRERAKADIVQRKYWRSLILC